MDKIPLADKMLDRRIKLLPCQKEMVKYWHERGTSIHGLSRMFHVNKRLIQFILFPERQKRNIELRRERGGYKNDPAAHLEASRSIRKYKQELFVKDYPKSLPKLNGPQIQMDS